MNIENEWRWRTYSTDGQYADWQAGIREKGGNYCTVLKRPAGEMLDSYNAEI